MKFAPIITEVRARSGMRQADLARVVGVSERAIWLAENGAGSLQTLIPIIDHLRIAITGLPRGHNLGARVEAARLKRGWSLQNLADRTGLSIPTLRNLESGKGHVASLEKVIEAVAPTIRARRREKARREAPREPVGALVQRFVNADCIEFMPTLESASVDLVITSPPYNAGKEYEPNLAVEEYLRFADQWVSCVPRLLTPTGALWLNVKHILLSETEAVPLTYFFYPLLVKHGLHVIQEVTWHHEGGLAYSTRFSHRTERWMWCVKDPKNYVFHLDDVRDKTLNISNDKRSHPEGKNPTDYWHYPTVVGDGGQRAKRPFIHASFP